MPWALSDGRSNGVSLTINGHMDTSYTGTAEDRMFCRAPRNPTAISKARFATAKCLVSALPNMKSGLAAFMVAAKAIKESGISLKGDLILAAVAGKKYPDADRTCINPKRIAAKEPGPSIC